jgi:hypothetical protein
MIYSRPRPHAPSTPATASSVTLVEHQNALRELSQQRDALAVENQQLRARIAELEATPGDQKATADEPKRGKRGG